MEILSELIRVPSVNPDLAPGEGQGESAIAEFVRDWCATCGIKCRVEEVAPGRPNAVARVGNGGSPTLLLCAHLDTVSTAGMTIPPFEPRIEGNRVFGRGSYDMKSGAAAILSALAQLVCEPLQGTVIAALVADEEYASIGASDFVKRHKADACILTEPSEGRLILAHKGFFWAEIVTEGRAAHGSRWDLGVSAIGKMGRIIAALERFDSEVLRKRVHLLVGSASQHCSVIQGGVGPSTYAPSCTLQLERRMLPGETPEQVLVEIQRVIAEAGEEARVRCVMERPALVCPRDAKIAACVRHAAAEVTGHEPEEAGVSYWMDAAIFAAAGIETVNFGAGGAGAHEAVEWADADSVVTLACVLAQAARSFCL